MKPDVLLMKTTSWYGNKPAVVTQEFSHRVCVCHLVELFTSQPFELEAPEIVDPYSDEAYELENGI